MSMEQTIIWDVFNEELKVAQSMPAKVVANIYNEYFNKWVRVDYESTEQRAEALKKTIHNADSVCYAFKHHLERNSVEAAEQREVAECEELNKVLFSILYTMHEFIQ